MIWCLLMLATLTALLALAALMTPRIKRPSPGRLVRGCAASVLLLIAGGLAGLAFLL
ncbi:hypothetical protein [Roseiflexus sp.]|uniref:hypothetical protein n=1 Tax=Roseiflexus sp. TaxID=2562120 RepID=UPI00398B4A15